MLSHICSIFTMCNRLKLLKILKMLKIKIKKWAGEEGCHISFRALWMVRNLNKEQTHYCRGCFRNRQSFRLYYKLENCRVCSPSHQHCSWLLQAMARHSIFFVLILFLFISVTYAASDDRSDESGVYIVYMGGKGSSTSGTLRDDQAQLMNLFLKRSVLICTTSGYWNDL